MASLTLFPLQFQRQDAVPIDIDSVFTSTIALNDYLTSPRRYKGQLVSVSDAGSCPPITCVYLLNCSCNTWCTVGPSTGGGDEQAQPIVYGTIYGCTRPYSGSLTTLGLGVGAITASGYNIAIGCCALNSLTAGQCNVAIGVYSQGQNCCGCDNVSAGTCSLQMNISGKNNVAMGHAALYNNFSCFNTAVGYCALYCNTTGSCNSALGALAGSTNTTGKGNTFIGYNAQGLNSTASYTMTLGNTAISCIIAPASSITAFSDCRDKTNICSIPIGLEFIRALRPVKFEWNMRDNPNDGKKGKSDAGFIAQELDQVVQQFDAEWIRLVSKENPNRYEATIGRLLPVAIKAIQELAEATSNMQSRLI